MSHQPLPPAPHHRELTASGAVVTAPATTVWSGPDRARHVDAAIVGPQPDLNAWLAAMDGQSDPELGRLGLHGRVLTQLVEGEPVTVIGVDSTSPWSQVLAPWQPSPGSRGGYPGWVPSAHLDGPGAVPRPDAARPPGARTPAARLPPARPSAAGPAAEPGRGDTDDEEHPALGLAREHLGLPYLWGGLTPLGLDCSGLVHLTWRRLGIVVPRDAWAQAEAATAVDLGDVRSGDLYFFAHPERRIHHVGIVVSPGRMVHASETGRVLVEEELATDRLETLVGAGRLPSA